MSSFRTVFFDEPMTNPNPPLELRRPRVLFAAGACALMFGFGLTLALLTVSGLTIDPARMGVLAQPVLAATLAAALSIGPSLLRRELRSYSSLIFRAALIWAFFGLAWPALFTIGDMIEMSYALKDPSYLREVALGFAKVGLVGLVIGAACGAVSAAIAGAICLKRA